jgi:hypothetical protein
MEVGAMQGVILMRRHIAVRKAASFVGGELRYFLFAIY